jgi:hypothetical protein
MADEFWSGLVGAPGGTSRSSRLEASGAHDSRAIGEPSRHDDAVVKSGVVPGVAGEEICGISGEESQLLTGRAKLAVRIRSLSE